MSTSESFQQLALRFTDPVQHHYEVTRGIMLADETVAERSRVTGMDRDTVSEKARRSLQADLAKTSFTHTCCFCGRKTGRRRAHSDAPALRELSLAGRYQPVAGSQPLAQCLRFSAIDVAAMWIPSRNSRTFGDGLAVAS